jgi:hypothetical protein
MAEGGASGDLMTSGTNMSIGADEPAMAPQPLRHCKPTLGEFRCVVATLLRFYQPLNSKIY